MDVASISLHRYGGITRGNDVIDIVRFTDIHRSIYVNLRTKYKAQKLTYLETECQKISSYRSYVHRHASAEKLTYFEICLLTIRNARVEQIYLGACLLLDLSAKDTATELI